MKWTNLDNLVRRVTAFESFEDMISARHGSYFPSLYGTGGHQLARVYDFAMRISGDSRRAYFGGGR